MSKMLPPIKAVRLASCVFPSSVPTKCGAKSEASVANFDKANGIKGYQKLILYQNAPVQFYLLVVQKKRVSMNVRRNKQEN